MALTGVLQGGDRGLRAQPDAGLLEGWVPRVMKTCHTVILPVCRIVILCCTIRQFLV